MKDLNLLKKYIKNQEASYNFKLGFALSNRPHFNSVYLVRVPFLNGIAVYYYVFYVPYFTGMEKMSDYKHPQY